VRFDTAISVAAVGGKGNKNTSEDVEPPTFVAVTIICSPGIRLGDKFVNVAELLVIEEGVIGSPFLLNVYDMAFVPPVHVIPKLFTEEVDNEAESTGFVGGMVRFTVEEIWPEGFTAVSTIWSPDRSVSVPNENTTDFETRELSVRGVRDKSEVDARLRLYV